jgi:hypothetical protein
MYHRPSTNSSSLKITATYWSPGLLLNCIFWVVVHKVQPVQSAESESALAQQIQTPNE